MGNALIKRPVGACSAIALPLLLSVACDRADPEVIRQTDQPSPAADERLAAGAMPPELQLEELVEPYPAGRWRLADPRRLDRVMLWFSHILIRHRDVPSGLISFNLPLWTGAPMPPARTRQEAFELAQHVQERVRRQPRLFAEIARTYSEDVATRELGGSVGGMHAAQLARYPAVLDVLAAIQPDEVSRVVETGYGFHIVYRRSPPADGTVSGARVVVGHDDAPWLSRFFARSQIPARSRSEAQALAQEVYERARANPWDFEQLVARHTEHDEGLRGGDFGAWSAFEPTPFPREVEVLRGLKVGEVAPPLDSLFGFQVIQRTHNRNRVRYSAAWIEQMFDPSLPHDHPQSEASVAASLRNIAEVVASQPSRFAEYQRSGCCTSIQTWLEGAGAAPIEQALTRLAPGQIGLEPIRLPHSYVLVKRLTPAEADPDRIAFELPAPARPEVEALLAHSIGLDVLGEVGRTLPQRLQLAPEQEREVAALHQSLAVSDITDVAAAYRAAQARMQGILGAHYEEYLDWLCQAFESRLLNEVRLESRLALSRPPT